MNYQELIGKQAQFFNSNQTKDLAVRIKHLKQLKAIIKTREGQIYQAISADFKKSEFDTYTTELMILYAEIDEAIKHLVHWSRNKKLDSNLASFPASSFIQPEPLGVCLIIGAWNYPFLLSLGPVVAAIAAGNTVILKPSEIAANCADELEKIVNTNFLADYFMVVKGGVTETTALLSEKFNKIFFTGSVATGKIIYAAAAKHLTPVTLELGGKSPAIVMADADLKLTAKRLVWAKFLNAGQTCIAPDYIVVEEKVKKELLTYIKEWIQEFKYGFENNNYVQIINEKNFHRLTSLIDTGNIYFGGETDLVNRYIAPTILSDVNFEDKVMEDELFGPVLPVISFTDLNVLITKLKSLPKPLSCYAFTKSTAIKNKILTEFSFGGGTINDALLHISNLSLPFGGVGNSGIGSYHGEAGFKTFSHYKSIVKKPFWLDNVLRYSPNTKSKLKWIKRIIGS